jgi:hypothetical protein
MARGCESLCLLKPVSSGISIWYTKSMRAPMFSANLVFLLSDRPMMDRIHAASRAEFEVNPSHPQHPLT